MEAQRKPQSKGPSLEVRPLLPHQATLLHQLYCDTPNYFALMGSQIPTLQAVQADLLTTQHDPRRRLELLYDRRGQLVGNLDYKINYPAAGDLTINLLLIREAQQNQRLGEQAVRDLERRLPAGITRILASVLGDNPRGVRFWERLGYRFELDARPVMCWYAKHVAQHSADGATPPVPQIMSEAGLRAASD